MYLIKLIGSCEGHGTLQRQLHRGFAVIVSRALFGSCYVLIPSTYVFIFVILIIYLLLFFVFLFISFYFISFVIFSESYWLMSRVAQYLEMKGMRRKREK